MSDELGSVVNLQSSENVAARAARDTIKSLDKAIKERGHAVWVVAGGSSPMIAYEIISSNYAHVIDWSKVTFLIGDERLVPFDSSESNVGQISNVFCNTSINAARMEWPDTSLSVAESAHKYAEVVSGYDAIDVMWFGVGEDGHTLSLFPDHKDFVDSEDSVIAVRDSPKPPAERISFSLNGLSKVKSAIIFATGANKRQALYQVFNGQRLPIRRVAERLIDSKADVMWLFDEEARATSL